MYICSVFLNTIKRMQMKKTLKGLLALAAILALPAAVSSCSEEKELVGKWKLEKYETADLGETRLDSAFFNFMKGSFSMICIQPEGNCVTLFGNYQTDGKELTINIRKEDMEAYSGMADKYLGWQGASTCTYDIKEISRRNLTLQKGDSALVMKKY